MTDEELRHSILREFRGAVLQFDDTPVTVEDRVKKFHATLRSLCCNGRDAFALDVCLGEAIYQNENLLAEHLEAVWRAHGQSRVPRLDLKCLHSLATTFGLDTALTWMRLGANPVFEGTAGYTPIEHVLATGKTGADLDAWLAHMKTPAVTHGGREYPSALFFARHPDQIRSLMDFGADPDLPSPPPAPGENWSFPLTHLVYGGRIGALDALLGAGASLTVTSPDGLTPIGNFLEKLRLRPGFRNHTREKEVWTVLCQHGLTPQTPVSLTHDLGGYFSVFAGETKAIDREAAFFRDAFDEVAFKKALEALPEGRSPESRLRL
jgi:hypothetical protein